MGRELRRVPLDFDWPIGEVWSGYLMPDEMSLPKCTDCDGEGYGPEARAVAHTFYAHQIGGYQAEALAWCDKLGQAEVDHLIEKGRLSVWRDGERHSEPRTAEEINAINRRPKGIDGHDAINRMYLISFRCEQLGIPEKCPICNGHGDIGADKQRNAYENWEGTDPPEGEGYQLWNTTTEGHPMTPVFATFDELCEYTAEHCTTFADNRASAEGWRHMLDGGIVGVEMADRDGNRIVLM